MRALYKTNFMPWPHAAKAALDSTLVEISCFTRNLRKNNLNFIFLDPRVGWPHRGMSVMIKRQNGVVYTTSRVIQ